MPDAVVAKCLILRRDMYYVRKFRCDNDLCPPPSAVACKNKFAKKKLDTPCRWRYDLSRNLCGIWNAQKSDRDEWSGIYFK